MAKVWFVRRNGGQWVAPGGAPAYDLPLARIQFPLDLGTHRRLDDERPLPVPEIPAEPVDSLLRVMVEVGESDIRDRTLSGFEPGIYDSGLSPAAAAQRLSKLSP